MIVSRQKRPVRRRLFAIVGGGLAIAVVVIGACEPPSHDSSTGNSVGRQPTTAAKPTSSDSASSAQRSVDERAAARSGAKRAAWLIDVTQASGVDFVHETGATGKQQMPEIMCAGVALFDADNDGDLDIYFTNGTFDAGESQQTAEMRRDHPPSNRLYVQDAPMHFVDATAASGLGDVGYGMGVAVGDYDNDGWADVYVSNYGVDRLYRNRGGHGLGDVNSAGDRPQFEDVTEAANIHVDGWSASATFVDYDRDGYLDLFVTRYLDYDPEKRCTDFAGRADYCGPKSFPGISDVLLRNRGDGTFEDVSAPAGIAAKPGPGLGVVCADFDDDGWQDVFVANDGDANRLWMNAGDAAVTIDSEATHAVAPAFRDQAMVMGVALNWHGMAEAGMGVAVFDCDNDLDIDLFMTHLRNETNTLYRNEGGRRGFEDATGSSGIGPPSTAYTGFGTVAFDVELDGDVDVFVANGRVLHGDILDGVDVPPPWDFYAEPNQAFLNNGAGSFVALVDPVQAFVDPIEISRGLASGDIDNDGDIDLVVINAQGPARIYRNDAQRVGGWLLIRAVDPRRGGRDAVGARVEIVFGEHRAVRTIGGGHSYLSSSDPRAHFGIVGAEAIDAIVVRWPDGSTERFNGCAINQVIEIRQGEGSDALP